MERTKALVVDGKKDTMEEVAAAISKAFPDLEVIQEGVVVKIMTVLEQEAETIFMLVSGCRLHQDRTEDGQNLTLQAREAGVPNVALYSGIAGNRHIKRRLEGTGIQCLPKPDGTPANEEHLEQWLSSVAEGLKKEA
ncbi:MAG: hypothetical protein ABIA92_02570 [Patescibacteria group bacterium]